MSRRAKVERVTSESSVSVEIDLDGTGASTISTGVGFYDHMLTALARHSLIDMTITTTGDVHIDGHHSVEDTAIAIGQAIREALGDKKGIRRFGDAVVPLDEVFEVPRFGDRESGSIMIVIEAEGSRIALLVDELVGQQQVVVKNLEANYRKVPGVSGATILGDGRVALILDVGQLVRRARH